MRKAAIARESMGVFGLPIFILVAAILYVARDICIPFALAILLSFLLAPVITWLERIRLRRVPAVLLVMTFAIALLTVGGWLIVGQFMDLAEDLPQYQTNVHNKLSAFHPRPGGVFDQFNRTFENYSHELDSITSQPNSQPKPIQNTAATTAASQPIEVVLAKPRTSGLDVLTGLTRWVFGGLATFVIVVILTAFLLVQWHDVRDRAIRLIGSDQLHFTTKAMEDASQRVSRYLLMQFIVNILFGFCCGSGLYFIGVPYSVLWGLLAAGFRFIPYFGSPIAALFPLAMAFAVLPGFQSLILTAGLYAGLELFIGNFVEPWLYGSTTGISPIAILVSAIFWTFLWGPIGLLLSTPLTACLVVMGRHVPKLKFLDVIFGDEPVLAPPERFYQRLLASDQEGALDLAKKTLKDSSLLELYDSLMVPALVLAEQDRHHGDMEEKQTVFIWESIHDLILDTAAQPKTTDASKDQAALPDRKEPDLETGPVLCIPADDHADELSAMMLGILLKRQGLKVQVISSEPLVGERISAIGDAKPCAVCVSAVPPSGLQHARYMCKRLRAQYPELKVVAGIWQSKNNDERLKAKLPRLLVEHTATTLANAVTHLTAIVHFEANRSANSAAVH